MRAGRNIKAFRGIFILCFLFSVVCYLFLACDVIGGDVETMRLKLKLTVTFEANGGTPEPPEQKVVSGGKISAPPEMSKTGYTFDAWYKEAALNGKWNFTADTVKSNIKLYAKWNDIRPDGFTITFESNGGSVVPDLKVTSGGTVSRPPDPSRTGWVFSNWYTDRELTNVYNFSAPVISGFVLYASWVAPGTPRYIVSFNGNGGSSPDSQQVYEGERPFRPADPIRDGYAFNNWFLDTGFNVRFEFTVPIVRHTDLCPLDTRNGYI